MLSSAPLLCQNKTEVRLPLLPSCFHALMWRPQNIDSSCIYCDSPCICFDTISFLELLTEAEKPFGICTRGEWTVYCITIANRTSMTGNYCEVSYGRIRRNDRNKPGHPCR